MKLYKENIKKFNSFDSDGVLNFYIDTQDKRFLSWNIGFWFPFGVDYQIYMPFYRRSKIQFNYWMLEEHGCIYFKNNHIYKSL